MAQSISQPITGSGQAILTKGRELLNEFAPFDSKSQTLDYSNTVRGLLVGGFLLKVFISIIAGLVRLCQKETHYIPRNSTHDSPSKASIMLSNLPPTDEGVIYSEEGQTPHDTSHSLHHHHQQRPSDVVVNAIAPSRVSHHHHTRKYFKQSTHADTRNEGEPTTTTAESGAKSKSSTKEVEAYRLGLMIYADAYADGTRAPGKYRWAKRIATLLIVFFLAMAAFFASVSWTNDIGTLMFKRWNCYYMTLFNMSLLLVIMVLVELAFLIGEFRFGNALTVLEQSRSSVGIFLTREQIAQATRESYFLMSYGVRNVAIAVIYLAFGRSLETLADGQGSYQEIFMDVCAYALYIVTIVSLACNEVWRESPPTVYGILVTRLFLNIIAFIGLVLAIVPITDINQFQGNQTDWRESYGWKAMTNFIICVVIIIALVTLLIISSCQPEILRRRKKKLGSGEDDSTAVSSSSSSTAVVSTEPFETSPEDESLLEGGGKKPKKKHRKRN